MYFELFFPYQMAIHCMIDCQMQSSLLNVTSRVWNLISCSFGSNGLVIWSEWMTTKYQTSPYTVSSTMEPSIKVDTYCILKTSLNSTLNPLFFSWSSFEHRSMDWNKLMTECHKRVIGFENRILITSFYSLAVLLYTLILDRFDEHLND